MRDVYLVNCCRTAVGSFGGSLKDVPAPELGAIVVKEVLNRAGVKPRDFVHNGVSGRKQDNGCGMSLPEASQHLKPVKLGQHDVEKNKAEIIVFRHFEPGTPVEGLADLVTLMYQLQLNELKHYLSEIK